MEIESKEITDFINAVKDGIAKSQADGTFELMSNVDFELSVVAKKQGEGKVNIVIAGIGAESEKQSISRIRFSMGSQATMDRGISAVGKMFSELAKQEKSTSLPTPKDNSKS